MLNMFIKNHLLFNNINKYNNIYIIWNLKYNELISYINLLFYNCLFSTIYKIKFISYTYKIINNTYCYLLIIINKDNNSPVTKLVIFFYILHNKISFTCFSNIIFNYLLFMRIKNENINLLNKK